MFRMRHLEGPLASGLSQATDHLAKLSQESGVAASTLKNFHQVLVDTFVGHWIPAYTRRARRRLLTTPRFLFFDVGVRNAAAGLPLSSPPPATEAGPLLEQWVAQELIVRPTASSTW